MALAFLDDDAAGCTDLVDVKALDFNFYVLVCSGKINSLEIFKWNHYGVRARKQKSRLSRIFSAWRRHLWRMMMLVAQI